MADLLAVKISDPDAVILDIAKHQTMLPFSIDKVTETLSVIELRVQETSVDAAYSSRANLLNE